MDKEWLQRWEDRYSEEGFAFGTAPNEYLRTKLKQFTPGSILFGAEGEGRNAVYAAQAGWESYAFDISMAGKKKAMQLAADSGVSIHYDVGLLPGLSYQEAQFDAIALIYAHFPPDIKSAYNG